MIDDTKQPHCETGAEMLERWRREDAAHKFEDRRFCADWDERDEKTPPLQTKNLTPTAAPLLKTD